MRLVILETSDSVGKWAAKYVMKRINDFKPSADKYGFLSLSLIYIYNEVNIFSDTLFWACPRDPLHWECTRS